MTDSHRVYLALGSNLGNRATNIHAALKRLAGFARLEATSFLYETPPAYVVDQPAFLNAVCQLATTLAPRALLDELQRIEEELGRRKTRRYGPRIIDLDILFYDDLSLASEDLEIPHARLAERDFVLEPLCDLAPDLHYPRSGLTVQEMWRRLDAMPLPRVMPVGDRLWTWGRKTYIMGIINVTPDSFSGDGIWSQPEQAVERAVAQAERFVAAGADCLDIGGHSTRPGHALVPEEEEIARVVPIVRALAERTQVPISVDTFRAEVGREALAAGAHMVNDVWALRLEPDLGRAAAAADVPVVIMHNRMVPPDPDYQARLPQPLRGTEYEDLMGEIRTELGEALDNAQALGIRRWLLIPDPGIGFGKDPEQNLELIRRLGELSGSWRYPLLVGPSRKSFIGKALGDVPPSQRVEGTAAVCVLAIERGTDILRVHDVETIGRAARMTDAVVRQASM